MRLDFRVDKVFHLGHQEFPHAQQTGTRGDLIAKGLADGRRSKGHLILVELQHLLEVDELSLRRLWSEIAGRHAARSDGRLEHQVERDGWEDLVVRLGHSDVILLDQSTQLRAVVVVNLGIGSSESSALVAG